MAVSKKDFFFVGLQLALFAAYLFEVPLFDLEVPEQINFLHLAFAVFGTFIVGLGMLQLNKNLSPFPTPKKDSALITSGLFKYVRHPIYTGILIAAFFLAFYLHSGYKFIVFLLLLILFYYKSKYEEKALLQKFPEYESYKANTGRFIPKF
jgi:protein-S-isoprenylcysteine O-methyltransferase Ste14